MDPLDFVFLRVAGNEEDAYLLDAFDRRDGPTTARLGFVFLLRGDKGLGLLRRLAGTRERGDETLIRLLLPSRRGD